MINRTTIQASLKNYENLISSFYNTHSYLSSFIMSWTTPVSSVDQGGDPNTHLICILIKNNSVNSCFCYWNIMYSARSIKRKSSPILIFFAWASFLKYSLWKMRHQKWFMSFYLYFQLHSTNSSGTKLTTACILGYSNFCSMVIQWQSWSDVQSKRRKML